MSGVVLQQVQEGATGTVRPPIERGQWGAGKPVQVELLEGLKECIEVPCSFYASS